MPGPLDFFPQQQGGTNVAGTAALDPGESQSLALLQAMGNVGQAGMQRTASPIGAISQGLMPILGAMIQAKALQAQSQQQAQMQELQKLNLLSLIASRGGTKVSQPKNLQEILAQRVQGGQPTSDVVDLMKQIQKPAADTELSLVKQSLGTQASDPQAVLNALATQKQNEMAGAQAAKAPGELDLFRQKEAIKQAQLKDPPREMTDRLASQVSSVKSLDDALKGFESTTKFDILKGTLTHGILSNQALKDYNKFFNDLDNARAGARGMTKAALERIRNELPNPLMATTNPEEFMTQLRKVRGDTYDDLRLRTGEFSTNYRIGDDIKSAVDQLAPGLTNRGPQPTPTPMTFDFKKPTGASDTNLNGVFENLQKQFPNKSASELADEYYKNRR
jgi:hypothetical protein